MIAFVTVSNALLSAILDGAPLPETEKWRLAAEVGLAPEVVRDVNGRTSIIVLSRLWSRILDLTGDPFVGLHIGRAVPGERFGLAVHAAQNKDTLREGLVDIARYAGLINAMITCSVHESPDEARFAMKFHWDVFDLERHAVDITFAGLAKWGRERICERFAVREVRLRHKRTEARERYEAAFGAPVTFAAATNEVVFDPALLDQRIQGTNNELGRLLDGYAQAELVKIPALASLPSRVSQLVLRDLAAGTRPDLAAICDEVKMTPRQLQRKLGESSTSFSALLDEARKSLAPRWLDDPVTNVEQVGFRLGYAEPTAFIRAFKKWYGMTPGQYRKTRQLP